MKTDEKNTVIFSFSAQHKPVAEIKPDEVLVIETADCFNGQLKSEEALPQEIDWQQINPVTGPFYVLGAEPGDALEIEILEITPASQGVLLVGPGIGLTGAFLERLEHRLVKISGNAVVFAQGINLPYQPMVGVIGVAPLEGEVATNLPGSHGGNLDTKEIRPGSKVLLPVYHFGALLALGDLHALMGDGEVSGTGVEMAGEVKIRVRLQKKRELTGPQVSFDKGVALVRSGSSLEQAVEAVTQAAVEYIEAELGLDRSEAVMLAGTVCQLRLSQVVNPMVTVKMIVPDFSNLIAK
jgi:amidase